MADDDSFEIDIYGESDESPKAEDGAGEVMVDRSVASPSADNNGEAVHKDEDNDGGTIDMDDHNGFHDGGAETKADDDMNGAVYSNGIKASHTPQNGTAQTSLQQGVKRKEAPDDRSVDPGASAAILLTDLNWWNTEDDVRGWANACSTEDELKDVTFNEHKVNGKSKGQAFVDFTSPQAATALKRYLESTVVPSWIPATKKLSVSFANPTSNPFRTLPKDAPARNGAVVGGRGGYNANNDRAGAYSSFGARGKGVGGRGGFNNQRGGFNQNPMQGNFGMGQGFQGNPMGNMSFNRGGMMPMGGGMRGGGMGGRGRGGFNQMPMGGMMPNMGMAGPVFNPSMGMMGGYNAGPPNFMNGMNGMNNMANPAFFGAGAGQQMGGGDWNNPHGAKRPRGE